MIIENLYDKSCQILTPDGFRSVQYLVDENAGQFRAYSYDCDWLTVNAIPAEVDEFTFISTAVLNNGFTNITGGSVDYLTAIDTTVDARGILQRPLKAIHYTRTVNNDFVFAGIVAAAFQYDIAKQQYYIVPNDSRYFQTELLCLFGIDIKDRCSERIYLHADRGLKELIYRVFGTQVSEKSIHMPLNLDELTLYEKSSLLRGLLTVYLDCCVSNKLRFLMPNEKMMGGISEVLAELGIPNQAKKDWGAPVINALNVKTATAKRLYTISIAPADIPRFMTTIGLVTCDAEDHVCELQRKNSVRCTSLLNQQFSSNPPYNLYSLIPEEFDDRQFFWIIVGGVYTKVQRGNTSI